MRVVPVELPGHLYEHRSFVRRGDASDFDGKHGFSFVPPRTLPRTHPPRGAESATVAGLNREVNAQELRVVKNGPCTGPTSP